MYQVLLMIATSCDILQDMFSSVTELSQPMREPNVGCAHVMGVSFSSRLS
jgi:hypothetical protein